MAAVEAVGKPGWFWAWLEASHWVVGQGQQQLRDSVIVAVVENEQVADVAASIGTDASAVAFVAERKTNSQKSIQRFVSKPWGVTLIPVARVLGCLYFVVNSAAFAVAVDLRRKARVVAGGFVIGSRNPVPSGNKDHNWQRSVPKVLHFGGLWDYLTLNRFAPF